MDVENNFIKPILTYYFGKGFNEVETHKEITQNYSKFSITHKTIKKWFEIFRKNSVTKVSKKLLDSKKVVSDESLINLVNKNPTLNLEELGKLVNISGSVLSKRLSLINEELQVVNYQKKNCIKRGSKFSEKFIIELINNNPSLNVKELSNLVGCSKSTIYNRLKEINNKRSNDNKVNLKIYKSRKSSLLSSQCLINLITENPSFNMSELAKLANTSVSTISNRVKEINSAGKKVYHRKKGSQSGYKKLSNEFLIKLVKENPGLNLTQLSKLANTSTSVISYRLKKINIGDDEVNYFQKISKTHKDEFIVKLINENPLLNLAELSKLSNISASTISYRIKKINSISERVTYCKKYKQKFSNGYLINLINSNPGLNITELAKLANTSQKTMSNRLNQINNSGKGIIYCIKRYKKFSDDYLINLVNENPGLNMKELAQLVNVTTSAISYRLKKINSKGERVNYIKKNCIDL